MRVRFYFCLIMLVVLSILLESTSAHASPRCFIETNTCIEGRIAEFWEQNGNLAVFGYPLGAPEQRTIDGKTFIVQQFQRNRLELHPENAQPYDVLLGRLGADRLSQQGRDWTSFATSGCTVYHDQLQLPHPACFRTSVSHCVDLSHAGRYLIAAVTKTTVGMFTSWRSSKAVPF